MLPPSSLTIGKIPNRISAPRQELPGARLEVETLTGPGGTPLGMSLTVEQLAEFIGATGYADLLLLAAQELLVADPPGIVANTLYGITGTQTDDSDPVIGTWNGSGIVQTVYVHGVRPNSYHRLGVVYDEHGLAQLVEVDVVAGTYKRLSGREELLASDNPWTGTNTFAQQVTVLDLFVTSVQNVALNTFSKLASFVAGLVPRLGATTAANPAAPLSALPISGWGLQNVGNVFSLQRDVSKLWPGPGLAEVSLYLGDEIPLPGKNVTTSPHLPAEEGLKIVVNKPVADVAFYDVNRVFIGGVGVVSSSTTCPAKTKSWRFRTKTTSGTDNARVGVDTVYSEVYYQLDSLGIVTGIQTSNGVLRPDAKGIIDGTQLGGGPTGVATPSGTVLVFTQDAEYATIPNGTFTVNTTGAKAGTTVFAELGAAASQPTLDTSVFEPEGVNTYQEGRRHEYGFRVAASGKIRYVINYLP